MTLILLLLTTAELSVVPASCDATGEDVKLFSSSLQGRHWLDCDSSTVKVLEQGFRNLSSLPPARLESATEKYLQYVHDGSGAVRPLEDRGVLYKRSVDVAVLNMLLLGPPYYIDLENNYGRCDAIAERSPWKWGNDGWELVPPATHVDPLTSKPIKALEELRVVLRVVTSFAADDVVLDKLRLDFPDRLPVAPIKVTLVDSGERLKKNDGLRLAAALTNISQVAVPVPAVMSRPICWRYRRDARLPLVKVVSDSRVGMVRLIPLLPGERREYRLSLEQDVDFTSTPPGKYSFDAVFSTNSRERVWLPPSDTLFYRFEAALRCEIEVFEGDEYVIRSVAVCLDVTERH